MLDRVKSGDTESRTFGSGSVWQNLRDFVVAAAKRDTRAAILRHDEIALSLDAGTCRGGKSEPL